MSVENLKEYARRCAAEPELRTKAKEIGMSDAAEHMRHAESLGLDWTLEDMVAFRKEVIDAEGDLEDLSEQDLEQVAGGAVTATGITVAVAVGAVAVGAGTAAVVGAGSAAAVGGAAAAGDGGW